MIRIYLLDLSELNTPEELETFCEEAMYRVDGTRREKATHIGGMHERALSLGAGLLLQWAACAWKKDNRTDSFTEEFSASSVWEFFDLFGVPVKELKYRIGENGKPRFARYPMHFNLSHSGDYAMCVCSDTPIGADIQQIRPNIDIRKLMTRFFTEQERDEVLGIADETEQRELFFRRWTRREAYTKLTGEGLAQTITRPLPADLNWIEFAPPEGYAAIACTEKKLTSAAD